MVKGLEISLRIRSLEEQRKGTVMSNILWWTIAWLPALLIFGVVSSMEFEDQLKQQDLYCEMVSSGAWGDYNGNFKDVCPDERANDAAQEKGSSDQ
jgi:hypothetical protein